MRRTAAGLGLAVLLALAGCAGSGDGAPEDTSPPSVLVTTDDGELELTAWSFCWSGGRACGDRIEPEDPPSVGAPMHVDITFPEYGWLFQATFTEVTEEPCALTLTTTAELAGDGVHRLDPIASTCSIISGRVSLLHRPQYGHW